MAKYMPTNFAIDHDVAKRNANIKALAATGSFTQSDLAKRFGISQGRVSQIVRNPNADWFIKRAEPRRRVREEVG